MAIRIIHPLIKAFLIAGIAGAASGCAAGDGNKGTLAEKTRNNPGPGLAELARTPTEGQVPQAGSIPHSMQAMGTGDAVIPLKTLGNENSIPLNELARVLQFTTDWDGQAQKLRMGDNDFPYELTIGSKRAMKDGDAFMLPAAPIFADGAVYLPAAAVSDLFREEMSYDLQGNRFIVHPSNEWVSDAGGVAAPGQSGDGLDFGDDPNDPFKEPIPSAAADSNGVQSLPPASRQAAAELPAFATSPDDDETAVPAAAKNIDMNALIRKGIQYMGVKYQFGTAPYPASGRFDCSTYTQYLFGKYGVSLPRLARQQAQRGTTVSRKSLRKGDLMFFYVPGRFKSNRTVGHVGIYMGGGRMLHSSPEPKNGVQISNIQLPYWKKTFLLAKRVAY